jgi:hypothetical protein
MDLPCLTQLKHITSISQPSFIKKMLASKRGTIIIAGMATVIAMMAAALLIPHLQQQNAEAQQQSSEWPLVVRVQKTIMSTAAPVKAPDQPLPHQTVFALPIRDDGKVWSGKVTFVASKPIEIEVIHRHNPSEPIDAQHGSTPVAVINGTTITYSHMESNVVETDYVSGDVPISSGTLDFIGDSLVFHKRSGEPFTVTYTLEAYARTLTE